MEKCKSKDGFVREVVCAPEPMAFLATDRQLKDIELYCAQLGSFSILGVDATINLGDFSVTPMTYRPLKIYNVRTGKHPVFLGPLLVHESKTEQTYPTHLEKSFRRLTITDALSIFERTSR